MAEANPLRGFPKMRRTAVSFPGNLHLVLVLQPTSNLQHSPTDIGFRFSQEDFTLKMPGMMVDEADEFVAGPQSKKRGGGGDPSLGVAPKRRRSMSPLLRRPPTPPIVTNHVLGKGPPGTPSSNSFIKTSPAPKGTEGGLVPGTESNGGVRGVEPDGGWPGGLDGGVASEPGGAVGANHGGGLQGDFGEDGLGERPAERAEHGEELSPPGAEGCAERPEEEADPVREPDTIFIPPLEGSNAELRMRVIKEVRKPGRNYQTIFRLLEEVRGPVEVQKYFIQNTIKEASRFKKRVLIQQLEAALEEMDTRQLMTNNAHCR